MKWVPLLDWRMFQLIIVVVDVDILVVVEFAVAVCIEFVVV